MRRDLIDDARRAKRSTSWTGGGNETITMEMPAIARQIDRLMPALYASHPHLPQVVELKFFLGLPDEECADVLGIDVRSFQRLWQDARWWLYQQTTTSEIQ